ncbi:MAG: glycosyltransferase family 4 protein [Stellaceae bacterium]
MASVALVQNFPYDAAFGGDGTYIQSIAQYLQQSGHSVHGLTADLTRGRTSPIYKSVFPVERFASWRARKAVRLGKRTFLNLDPAQIKTLAIRSRRALGLRVDAGETRLDNGVLQEASWVLEQLQRLRPGAVILCFGAIHYAPHLVDIDAKMLALPGPIPGPGRWLRTAFAAPSQDGEASPADNRGELSAAETRLAASLSCADLTGFNNADELAYASRQLNIKETILVGMGFPGQVIFPQSEEPVVLFVGNATGPNRSAISWFLSRIWPAVHTSCPGAELRIVGKAAFTVEAGQDPSVMCVGPVPDLAAEYRRAQLVIAPLDEGTSGVKVKVAEAMSYGRPLVTTSIGVDPADREQLESAAFVTDDPDDFAEAVITLLTNADIRHEKSRGADAVFRNCFSYEATYRQLSEWLAQATAKVSKPEIATVQGR